MSIETEETTADVLKPCQCADFADATTGATTNCDGVTYQKFAPGHDARLKGFLIRAGREGHKIRVLSTGEVVSSVEAASPYGFAGMVSDGIRRRPGGRPEPRAVVRQGKGTVSARVGRWTYQGQVRKIDGEPVFVYQDRRGNERRSRDFVEV